MKQIILFVVVLLALFNKTFASNDSTCVNQYWGSKQLYVPADTTCSAPPSGYYPVFINHVTRHGARHLTSVKSLTFLNKILEDAAKADGLTTKGLQLQRMIQRLLIAERKEDAGLLTIQGKEEQEGIGARMRLHYPSLINDSATQIFVTTTFKERTIQSAQSFIKGLLNDSNAKVKYLGEDSTQLRFFDLSPAYKEYKKQGDWVADLNKLKNAARGQKEQGKMLREFFKTNYAVRLLQQTDIKTGDEEIHSNVSAGFIDAVFDIALLPAALQKEINLAGYTFAQTNVRSLLTCDELDWLEFYNSAEDFMQKGPAMDSMGIQVRNAVPLLVDFIKTSDRFLSNNQPAVYTRFAHGETMAPIAALLDIKGLSTAAKNISGYRNVWNIARAMGYSANLQWVFYKSNNPQQAVLVKILYNEKPAEIPVTTDMFPYYRWQDVKDYYLKKLAALHVHLYDNMPDYLEHLQ